MKLKLLDLFSGIGGFSLGLESTGYFETIAFVEKDEFCQKVLRKNFNNIPIESEVRNVKGNKYAADIITGGFPCQPFSIAGKRKGTDDDRYLWDETIRVIRECKPRWFIGENVEGIINIQDGMVLRQVQDDLEKEGFEVQCLVIPASGIGAWHQRKRVWIIAHSNSNRDRHEISRGNGEEKEISREHRKNNSTAWKFIGATTHDVPNSNSRLSKRETEQVQARGNASTFSREDVPNSNCELRDGCSSTTRISKTELSRMECDENKNRYKIWCETERCSEQNIRETKDATNTSSEGSQGYGVSTNMETMQISEEHIAETDTEGQQTWWQTQSKLCGIPHGLSTRLDKDRKNRIKALGNSIVPLIARQLGLAIMKAEEDNG